MIEVRWHGRGGQGSFTVARLLGAGAVAEGRFAQAFPSFGPERRGAPVTGFTRIDAKKILNRSEAMNPDYVVVLDETLFGPVTTVGIKTGGIIVINTAFPEKYPSTPDYHVAALDGTSSALEILGRPISNMAMLAALTAVSEIVQPETMKRMIREALSEAQREKNVELFNRAYQQMKGGV